MQRLIQVALCSLLLSGCVGVFVAGAATGGLIVYDRRNVETIMSDQTIRYQVERRIAKDPQLKNAHINVDTYHGDVLLTGQTPLSMERFAATAHARQTPHVKHVYNELVVGSPTTAMVRSADVWLATKIRTAMLTTKGLSSGSIKIVTENSSVYLMGHVYEDQAELAVDVARRIKGVQRIVKVFRINKNNKSGE